MTWTTATATCAACGEWKRPAQIAFVLDYDPPETCDTWLRAGDAVCTFCADQAPELFDDDPPSAQDERS